MFFSKLHDYLQLPYVTLRNYFGSLELSQSEFLRESTTAHVIFDLIQVTAPWAYTFIAIQHNDSSWVSTPTGMTIQHNKYTIGWKDACAVFFYFLITIIMHAVIQEYIFDVGILAVYQ